MNDAYHAPCLQHQNTELVHFCQYSALAHAILYTDMISILRSTRRNLFKTLQLEFTDWQQCNKHPKRLRPIRSSGTMSTWEQAMWEHLMLDGYFWHQFQLVASLIPDIQPGHKLATPAYIAQRTSYQMLPTSSTHFATKNPSNTVVNTISTVTNPSQNKGMLI